MLRWIPFEESKGRTPVSALANAANYSSRHLKNVFDQWVGLSPKMFSRITRFQAILGEMDPEIPPKWTDMAYGHGYVDQSHLIRDFEEFAGLSPAEFFATVVSDEIASVSAWKALQPDGLRSAS